jgi:hypothetical protein
MARLKIVVEGQTEERFVKDVLADHLAPRNVFATAFRVGKPGHRGGIRSYLSAQRDLRAALTQDRGAFVSTMFDYYAMPDSWPGRIVARAKQGSERACVIEAALSADIASSLDGRFQANLRFLPYVQLHEFEALLFASPQVMAREFGDASLEAKLQEVRDGFDTPEDINDDPQTAPSKRIESIFGDYKKPLYGKRISMEIGIPVIRAACPHFHDWLTRLERLAAV